MTGLQPSFWLLVFSMFVFFSLACLKRIVELNAAYARVIDNDAASTEDASARPDAALDAVDAGGTRDALPADQRNGPDSLEGEGATCGCTDVASGAPRGLVFAAFALVVLLGDSTAAVADRDLDGVRHAARAHDDGRSADREDPANS